MDNTEREVSRLVKAGARQVSFADMQSAFAEIGYKFDRSMDCRASATDCNTGDTFPNLALYPVQIDNGLSAWNIDARRDTNFIRLQALRNEIFSVVRNHIAQV